MAKFDGKIEITFSQQDRALLKRVADGIEALGPGQGAKVRRLIETEGENWPDGATPLNLLD